jgi:alkyl sulfatase BDS1-like metallo-beta-lactamase superfamily hydrolase
MKHACLRALLEGLLCLLLAVPIVDAQSSAPAADSGSPANSAGGEPSALAPKPASDATMQANAQALNGLNTADVQDREDAQRGFVATLPDVTIKADDGHVVWSLRDYAFLLQGDPPPTVNPSLWRNAKLNMNNGLFKVTDRVYQVRGFDISNMDIIEGDTGLIVVDPLISEEVARAALNLYYEHRPRKPVIAVIYTHSHIDHFGGVKGVVSQEDVDAGRVHVLAPEGFLEHAITENVIAGNAMTRRALYMYGGLLPKGPRGQVDGGLGKTNSFGTVTLIAPTDTISKTGETRTIDGVQIVFQMAPNTEAPAEMLMDFPQFHALCIAEDAVHTLHNLYTLRGAEVRDATAWWKTLHAAIDTFGPDTEVLFAQHQWPVWGQQRVTDYLRNQRDMYKYIHDQSVRLMNLGYTMTDVAERLEVPPALAGQWYNRGYYGTVNHNAKAVYQKYLGWYDSNPAHLHPLPPVEEAKRTVEYMGGADAVVAKARVSYAKGDYRWVAEVLNQVVFTDPGNTAARNLEADALEQLGYQAESGPWRNEYLVGAYELRHGVPAPRGNRGSPDVLKAMPLDTIFDVMGVHVDPAKAGDRHLLLNWNFTDTHQQVALELEHGVLLYTLGKQFPKADATLTLKRSTLDDLSAGTLTAEKAFFGGAVQVQGNPFSVKELFDVLDGSRPVFHIMEP